MNRTKQNLALLFAVCCISFAGPLIKVALLFAMPPVAVAFYRLFFSTALLSAPNAKQKGFASFKNLTGKDKCLLAISGVCLALHFFCWISSLTIISTCASTVIVCTQPVFVMLGAFVFFRETPAARALPGVGCAYWAQCSSPWPAATAARFGAAFWHCWVRCFPPAIFFATKHCDM